MRTQPIQIFNLLLFCTSIIVLTSLAGCGGGDDGPSGSRQDEVSNALTSGTWKVNTVTVDGVDRTDMFEGMTLSFTSTNFSSTNAIPVWPVGGTWVFTDETATEFLRGDGIVVTILEATNASLQLELFWSRTTLGSDGRTSSIRGEHVFRFGK